MDVLLVVQSIQSMLAPAVMISACGLLLLSMNNKYSLVINRIRVLDQEKRTLLASLRASGALEDDRHRLENVDAQLAGLRDRVRLDRDTVLCYSAAIAFFLLNSLVLGLQLFLHGPSGMHVVSLALFLLGMLSVLAGIGFALVETWKGYHIVLLDLDGSDSQK